jgi:hypothetical protein
VTRDPRAAIRAEQLRRAAILREIDPDGDRCECGQPVDGHTPLAQPGPLSARVTSPLAHRPRKRAFGGAMGR